MGWWRNLLLIFIFKTNLAIKCSAKISCRIRRKTLKFSSVNMSNVPLDKLVNHPVPSKLLAYKLCLEQKHDIIIQFRKMEGWYIV